MEVDMIEDWLANAYEGMSRRQFIARMSITGISLAGFAMAANSVAGEVNSIRRGRPIESA